MFTIEQIKEAHSKVKSGADFPRYIQDLKELEVTSYNTFVTDGHTQYFGKRNYSVITDAKYSPLNISDESSKEDFVTRLKKHQNGSTDYPTFCNDCAETGIEKWNVDIDKMTCTYYDKKENEVLIEQIPEK
ncbi:MAG: DUF1398 family protein [Ignavibacteria bacterium]|nr:DUF1398 family protein [Ignavibacteria bacterium]